MTLQVGASLASGLKTALLDDTRGRLAQAAIGAFDCPTSVGGQVSRITRRRTRVPSEVPSFT